MSKTSKRTIDNPHADIELGFDRKPFNYFLTLPEHINEQTGIFIFLPGLNVELPNSNEIVRPFMQNHKLADLLNCITVSVDYFGIYSNGNSKILETSLGLSQIKTICEMYGIEESILFENGQQRECSMTLIIDALTSKGVTYIDKSASFDTIQPNKPDYITFGFLSAIDVLTVIGEIFKEFPNINKKKIVAYGISLGGYLVMLLAKLAPRTFAVIINNSGMVEAHLHLIANNEVNASPEKMLMGLNYGSFTYNEKVIRFHILKSEPWSIMNENSPNYFGDSHRKIRSLREENHRVSSDCRYYIAQGSTDDIVSLEEQSKMVEILRKYNEVDYRIITENDYIDNVFMSTNHALGVVDNVEFIKYFAEVDAKHHKDLSKQDAATDFDLNSNYEFVCADKIYRFNYKTDLSLEVSIESI